MKLQRFFAVFCAALCLGGSATAATLDITSIHGIWENAGSAVSGQGTSRISWGKSTGWGKSGYTFAPTPGTIHAEEETPFNLGLFQHLNHPIRGSFLQTTDLAVSFMVDGLDRTFTSVFSFAHWETANSPRTCANGERNRQDVNAAGCADRVTATLNLGQSDSFVIDGVSYVLDILGFYRGGDVLTEFWTRENAVNSAFLVGVFRTLPGEDNPPEVPLPGTALLLLGGLAGLAAVRRRR